MRSIFSINNMKKTLFLLCALCAATTASAKQYWVQGVSETGGWFDTNKTGNNDSGFCWAAADTNILSWWYQQNKAAAQVAQDNEVPHTQEALWKLFNDSFVNGDGHPTSGLRWYVNGTEPQSPAIKDTTKGDYSDILSVTLEDVVSRNIYSYDPAWEVVDGVPTRTGTTEPSKEVFVLIANDLKNYLMSGYAVALGMCGNGAGKHAVTLWGIEINEETGHMTKMWITDSDDDLYKVAGGPKYDDSGLIELICEEDWIAPNYAPWDQLNCYMVKSAVAGTAGDYWYKGAANNDQFYEFTAYKLAFNGTPEPATATLSLLALAGLAARRRRK